MIGNLCCVWIAGMAALVAPTITTSTAETRENSIAKRVLRKSIVVDATLENVWHAWTTAEGIAAFFAPEANIDLKLGGAYEIIISPKAPKGSRGGEGCRVLSYLPMRVLSFDWNAPPTIPSLRNTNARTTVVLRFSKVFKGKTKVSLIQSGWGNGDEWDKCYQYFDLAWPKVLDNLQRNISKIAYREKPADKIKSLIWEIDVNAPVEEVWRAFTTKKGIESWMVPLAEVDFQTGGSVRTNYNPQADANDPGWITHHVLCLDAPTMYASRFTSPGNAPLTKIAEATWVFILLEPNDRGQTHVTEYMCGWGQGEDWDQAEAFFQRGNAWTLNKLQERFASSNITTNSSSAVDP